MRVQLEIGDRVKFTKLALRKCIPARMRNPSEACGTCVGGKQMATVRMVLVRWKDNEHNEHAYHPDYIEKA